MKFNVLAIVLIILLCFDLFGENKGGIQFYTEKFEFKIPIKNQLNSNEITTKVIFKANQQLKKIIQTDHISGPDDRELIKLSNHTLNDWYQTIKSLEDNRAALTLKFYMGWVICFLQEIPTTVKSWEIIINNGTAVLESVKAQFPESWEGKISTLYSRELFELSIARSSRESRKPQDFLNLAAYFKNSLDYVDTLKKERSCMSFWLLTTPEGSIKSIYEKWGEDVISIVVRQNIISSEIMGEDFLQAQIDLDRFKKSELGKKYDWKMEEILLKR